MAKMRDVREELRQSFEAAHDRYQTEVVGKAMEKLHRIEQQLTGRLLAGGVVPADQHKLLVEIRAIHDLKHSLSVHRTYMERMAIDGPVESDFMQGNRFHAV